jgi:hypothetical protein
VSKDSDQTETAPRKFKLGHLGNLNQLIKALGVTIRAMAWRMARWIARSAPRILQRTRHHARVPRDAGDAADRGAHGRDRRARRGQRCRAAQRSITRRGAAMRVPPKYAKLAKRIEELEALVCPPKQRKCVRIIVVDGGDENAAKARALVSAACNRADRSSNQRESDENTIAWCA